MKKFQFGLDSVLSYRQQVLDSRQNEYAIALKRMHEQQARLEDAQARYQQMNALFRQQAAEGMTAADAMGFENGLRMMEGEIARESKLLQDRKREVEQKRAQVVQAHMDATVLERLKEKKKEDYQKAGQKQEEQFIDELVSAARISGGY